MNAPRRSPTEKPVARSSGYWRATADFTSGANAAPWQPTPADAYPLIDYTDLGDMAADPFVQKVQKLTGSAHVH